MFRKRSTLRRRAQRRYYRHRPLSERQRRLIHSTYRTRRPHVR